MKKARRLLVTGLMWLMLIAVGCSASTREPTPSASPTALATETTTRTATPEPTTTSTSTSTTVPPPPPLPPGDAEARLLELLANNGDCRLPCLWGIMPGTSSYQEAQAIIAPLSSISDFPGFSPEGGGGFPLLWEDDLLLRTQAGFLAENGIVTHLGFGARQMQAVTAPNGEPGYMNLFDSQAFGERLEYYSLSHVLSELGMPTSVLIATDGGPPGGWFDLLLLYPDQGVLANYTTERHLVGSDVRGCPANAHIEMDLFAPGNAEYFNSQVPKVGWDVKLKNWYKPLESVTSMTTSQFYETFRESANQCIDTPRDLWPVP